MIIGIANIFKEMFPLEYQRTVKYRFLDRKTIVLVMTDKSKLVFHYINKNNWSLQTMKSYED